jgi:hypothetical protein
MGGPQTAAAKSVPARAEQSASTIIADTTVV